MLVIEDPATEQELRQLARWYDIDPGKLAEIMIRHRIDELVAESPNLAEVVDLR